jgi:hypothetical protein
MLNLQIIWKMYRLNAKNRSGELEFESWLERSLARLHLPPDQTPDYQGFIPLNTGGLRQNIAKMNNKSNSNRKKR